MFKSLEYIECEKEDLSEIVNTLAPIHKTMKYFTGHYISGKDRYIKLTVASIREQKQDDYMGRILAKYKQTNPDKYEGLKNQTN